MSGPQSAREALILEALGELDAVLSRTEQAQATANETAQRIENAAAGFDAAASRYASELDRLTEATKRAISEHIERRVNAATAHALEGHRKAMQEAATLAFAEQLAPAVRDVSRQIEALQAPSTGSFALAKLLPALAAGACAGALAVLLLKGS